ncbi:Alpha/Beta hydrolase protein [Mycena rosella]|uniref:Alpha/Beta hydrolase protein n=1 Tax=Mycena rosella TaxID=1033263 RepID=A0AAD7D4E2_MYCRO|nr:Alpha/Beta hydrolase protein [Mycena rosella]
MLPTTFVIFTAVAAVLGAPTSFSWHQSRVAPTTLTTLTTADLDALDSFTQFARAAYCPADKLMAWDCGEACDANPDFQATLAGGMGNAVQFFFVGYYPKSNSVIVSHQGTDPLALLSVLTDLNVLKGPLNSTLFSNMPDGSEVHTGFRDEHAITAQEIQNEVKRLIAPPKSRPLGGALAELEALPAEVGVNAVTYGNPRVGNADFVSFFDSQVTDFKRVNNRDDLVPIVPPRFLGFVHPKGEIHIVDDDSNELVACPGSYPLRLFSCNDDATDDKCQIKTVPTILSGNILNHLGPYNGIHIGSIFCT